MLEALRRYCLRPTQETFHLCRCTHGHLHPNDQRVAGQFTFEYISLQEALSQSGSPDIHHSDQGVQYLSTVYISTLKEHGIQVSLARRGHPWENG